MCLSMATLLFPGDSAVVCYTQLSISKVSNNVIILSRDDLGNFFRSQHFVFHLTTNNILKAPVKKKQKTQWQKTLKSDNRYLYHSSQPLCFQQLSDLRMLPPMINHIPLSKAISLKPFSFIQQTFNKRYIVPGAAGGKKLHIAPAVDTSAFPSPISTYQPAVSSSSTLSRKIKCCFSLLSKLPIT